MADRTERTAIWKGLNRMPYIGDGEMRSMKNLSSDAYPYLTTRKGRKPYTFTTKILSPEGEAYEDTTQLPEPSETELGNIYKIIGEFESGAFYRYTDGIWVKQDVDISEAVTASGTLISGYATSVEEHHNDEYTEQYPEDKIGKLVKYTGETTELYEKNKVYRYCIDVWYGWKETDSSLGSDGSVDEMPAASSGRIHNKYKYTGTTTEEFTNGMYYKCYRYMQGRWEEAEPFYPVTEEPSAPAEGDTIRWCGAGVVTNGKSYTVCEDVTAGGETVYFVMEAEAAEDAIEVTAIPAPSAENLGKIYLYAGTSTGGFSECVVTEDGYKWEEVSHPKVSRTVTLKDYLDNYDGCGLSEILEIGTLKNDIAALIVDSEGNTLLYYDLKLWNTGGISGKSGKKLVTVGNKLVVGEAGSYLYIEDGTKKFFKSGESFAQSVTAAYASFGNGGEKYIWSSAWGEAGGKASFKIVAQGGEGAGFKTVYEGLSVPGTDFKVEFNEKTYYLTVSNVSYEENVLIQKWTTGSNWHYDYADRLTITATNCSDDFDWDNTGTGFSKNFFFESTDPHYYDVVAWKKRLWGYDENVMYGTAADIFDVDGIVDWNRGDNTNMEAVSQPLWQGGDITGIAALMNGLVYFKRDCITVVQGNYPAIMSSNTIPCRGLPPENRRSVAVINESVYYLSTDGVYRFDGAIPRCISRDIKISGTDAVGAGDGNKYYLSLKEADGEYALYVYDINRQTWHKEDNTHAASFTMLGGEMYMAVGTEIYNLSAPQESVEWECELWYDEGTHRKKRYKGFDIRGDVGACELYLKADDGEWQLKKAVDGKMLLQLPPFECRELGVKLKGRGICEIKSLDRTFQVDG